MADGILGNALGAYGFPKTYILTDENGNELTGVYVESETIFTATDNDVREGSVYAGDGGVSTGTKEIPAYYSNYGKKIVLANNDVVIQMPKYDYKNIMIVISTYNTSVSESVCSTYVSIDSGIYAVGSTSKIADIIVDSENKQINLGITVSEKSVLRYFVVTEEI